MKILSLVALSFLIPLAGGQSSSSKPAIASRDGAIEPAYDAEGRLLMPSRYREWIFLSSGIDMSYTQAPIMANGSMFDNVFVNPAAYRVFLQDGTWPDKTVLVTENRGAQSHGSINRRGNFQSAEAMGLEVHVRDDAKTPGGWAFYAFDSDKPSEKIPMTANCYSCHEQHAAVATTFVQFYPTLLPIAVKKKTLSASYLRDAARDAKP